MPVVPDVTVAEAGAGFVVVVDVEKVEEDCVAVDVADVDRKSGLDTVDVPAL